MPDIILIATDDEPTGAYLADNLAADGYRAQRASSAAHALALLGGGEHAAVICDFNGNTLTVVEQMRAGEHSASDIPLLALTGRDPIACVRYLERGCDDVVEKPFSYPELRARLGALLRRSRPRAATRIGALAIDPATRQVTVNGQEVKLTRLEYALLRQLAVEPTRVHTKQQLLSNVFGYPADCATRTLDSHAARLRHKLAEHGHQAVVNVWGVGYRLHQPLTASEAPC